MVYGPHRLYKITVYDDSLRESSHVPNDGPVWPKHLHICVRLHFVSSDQLMQQDASTILCSFCIYPPTWDKELFTAGCGSISTLYTSNCEAVYSETTERNPHAVNVTVFKPSSFLSCLIFLCPMPISLMCSQTAKANACTKWMVRQMQRTLEGLKLEGALERCAGGVIHMISSCGLSIDHLTRCHKNQSIHYGPCPFPDWTHMRD
jgi:hypothetical protein